MLRGEFESLLTLLRPEGGVDKGDLAKIKEQVFGPNVFWVTDTRLTDDLTEGGWLVRRRLIPPMVLGRRPACCAVFALLPCPALTVLAWTSPCAGMWQARTHLPLRTSSMLL